MEDFGLLDLGQNDDDMLDIRESSWLSKISNQQKAIMAIIESNHHDIQSLTLDKPVEVSAKVTRNIETEELPTEIQSITECEEEELQETPPWSTYEDILVKKFEDLGEEPADGILIAVQFSALPRIARRFRVTDDADFVYIWVASRPEVVSQGLKYGEFELLGPQNVLLAIGKTLAEQNIANRTIFNLRVVE